MERIKSKELKLKVSFLSVSVSVSVSLLSVSSLYYILRRFVVSSQLVFSNNSHD